MYLYPVQMIFWMDMYIHFASNAEMSRPKQFHVSRPKRNVFLTLWTLKPDISGFVHSLHCNHQMAAQNESMPVPV